MSECFTASWLTEEGKPAEVNQRALIAKVLARYPGEFTLFRELLQNSDDAQSSTVEIHFQTATQIQAETSSPALVDLKSSEVVRWTFKNNGKSFTPQDWRRLARIAEGNPDPAKVGAFGVGCYCLLSVTDRPFVSSAGYGMQFYWKDGVDPLFVQQGDLPDNASSTWTIFDIPLREPGHMPSGIDFMRFLATSITFMVHLKDVRVFFNEHRIGRIEKFLGPADIIELPIAMELVSPSRMLTVNEIRRHRFTIQAETSIDTQEPSSVETPESCERCDIFSANKSLFPPETTTFPTQKINPTCTYPATLDITVFIAEADVRVDEKLSRELIRCTAKKPPPQVKYSLVYTGKDDYDRSPGDQDTRTLSSIFRGLRADLNGASDTRIFIGQSTSQTTGIGGHMDAPFYPTVSRESIDFADRNIAKWNSELLYVGGLLSRTVYELEISDIEASWKAAVAPGNASHSRPASQNRLRERFIHVLKFFTFHHSTPEQKVSQALQDWFYACSSSPLRLLSSVGVSDTSRIRFFDQLCAQFLKHVPMLSQEVMIAGAGIIRALPDKHKIQPITSADVLQDLRLHTLDEGELVACLQWKMGHSSTFGIREFLEAACFRGATGTSVQLSSIQYFINPDGFGAHIPSDGPLPPSLIPRRITRYLALRSLVSFGWEEFTVVDWLEHISRPEIRLANPKHDFVQSIDWAESVLRSVSSAWLFSEEIRRLAKSVFGNEKCIPVHRGLCRPGESYLPSQNIPAFNGLQLPVVWFPSGHGMTAEMEQLLIALGVQQHLPPRLLLTRMVATGKWTTSELINYLVNVAETLSPADISELKSSSTFSKESAGTERFRADELYPPLDTFRQLQLPLIEWEGKAEWQDTSPQAKLLYRLGLRHHPPSELIIHLCSSLDATVRTNAFTYLCNNLRSVYVDYNPDTYQDIAFIPAEDMDGPRLERLGNVFLDNQWKIFGFPVIQHAQMESVIKELGAQRHPPSLSLVQLLETRPPANEEIARRWFEILSASEHVSCFSQGELDKLSQLQIVPKTVFGDQVYLTPVQCYLGKSAKDDFYSKLFHFVNFGSVANRFLEACHAKNEPSEEDIAESLLKDPGNFYESAGRERYLKEVRQLAVRQTRIPNHTLSKMRDKPVLLGVRRKKNANPDRWEDTYSLWEPSEIVIVDDVAAYQIFDDSLVIAPRDVAPELEQFYELLGCRYLSKVIRDQCIGFEEVHDAGTCSDFRKLVLQRVPVFLHHYLYPQAETLVPWPSSSDGISVQLFKRLSVTTTLTVGNKKTRKERDVWATAKYDQGEIQLLLSLGAKKDMYEIAVSLCRVLFGTVNLSAALLLATILSEDLDVLKRRGYEVDLVLKRQKWVRDCVSTTPSAVSACDAWRSEPRFSSTNSLGQSSMTESLRSINSATTRAQTTVERSGLLGGIEAAAGTLIPSVQLPLTVTNVVNNALRVVTGGISQEKTTSGPVAILPPSPWAPRQVLPRTYIRNNVSKAVKACATKARLPIDRHNQVDVTKFLREGYCNASGPIDNLRSLGKVDSVEVFVGPGVSEADTLMKQKHEQLSLFVRIITSIAKVYKLPLDSVHVFYNLTAGCIAFNCKGVVYLNLGYFEAWHYQDVKRGNAHQALSSWFLTVAHEIAHNLVASHDSEHEFWFSAICEAHMEAFSRLLGAPTSESVQAGGSRVETHAAG